MHTHIHVRMYVCMCGRVPLALPLPSKGLGNIHSAILKLIHSRKGGGGKGWAGGLGGAWRMLRGAMWGGVSRSRQGMEC